MSIVSVVVELDTDEWLDSDDPLPLKVSYPIGMEIDSVIEMLSSAIQGLEAANV